MLNTLLLWLSQSLGLLLGRKHRMHSGITVGPSWELIVLGKAQGSGVWREVKVTSLETFWG